MSRTQEWTFNTKTLPEQSKGIALAIFYRYNTKLYIMSVKTNRFRHGSACMIL
jgi:hypothetical protein